MLHNKGVFAFIVVNKAKINCDKKRKEMCLINPIKCLQWIADKHRMMYVLMVPLSFIKS